MSVEVFCPFFSGVVCFFVVELCILEIKPLSVASFAKIFLPCSGLSFQFGFVCLVVIFLEPHQQQVEVPRLGVESEL